MKSKEMGSTEDATTATYIPRAMTGPEADPLKIKEVIQNGKRYNSELTGMSG
ncbi:MAG: hypothetical protein R6X08_00100 [Desulfosalsimonadaceae bacterium]